MSEHKPTENLWKSVFNSVWTCQHKHNDIVSHTELLIYFKKQQRQNRSELNLCIWVEHNLDTAKPFKKRKKSEQIWAQLVYLSWAQLEYSKTILLRPPKKSWQGVMGSFTGRYEGNFWKSGLKKRGCGFIYTKIWREFLKKSGLKKRGCGFSYTEIWREFLKKVVLKRGVVGAFTQSYEGSFWKKCS